MGELRNRCSITPLITVTSKFASGTLRIINAILSDQPSKTSDSFGFNSGSGVTCPVGKINISDDLASHICVRCHVDKVALRIG